jgi:hypothetical protein
MSSGQAHNGQVRVLVVGDLVALADWIGEGLRGAGFAVDVVYDGAAALESTASSGSAGTPNGPWNGSVTA